jgi:glycosyltransferase involved in cell wall biosynthesis
MLSIIIATLDSERALVPTLAALVPGATSGIVSEVLVADAGSRDDTAAVADVAGCEFMLIEGPLGHRLRTAAAAAKAPWLMFLRPGTVLDAPWTAELGRFVQEPARARQAAVFRRSRESPTSPRELLSLVTAAFGALPRPEQGLVISKPFYDALGGHSDRAVDPERELLRRIGRRRRSTLTTQAFGQG